MRSVDSDDVTTRARIRDAAVLLFGRQGFGATTVRAIAADAGVSAALVIHHFGSKDGLRRACDEWILGAVTSQSVEISGAGPGTSAAIQRWLTDVDANRPLLEYIGRSISDGSDLGNQLFDDFVSYTEQALAVGEADGSVETSSDPRMRAVILTSYGFSALLFEHQIGRAIGEPGLNVATARRMTIPSLELFTHGLYRDDAMLRAARAALENDQEGTTP